MESLDRCSNANADKQMVSSKDTVSKVDEIQANEDLQLLNREVCIL